MPNLRASSLALLAAVCPAVALGCGGAIEPDAPVAEIAGPGAAPNAARLPTATGPQTRGSLPPNSAPRVSTRGQTLADLGVVTPLCMTRTGRHFLYLRRDGAGGAELRRLDLARLDDALVARRPEAELVVPVSSRLESPFGAEDTADSEYRVRCATDALGEHAVVHVVTGELLLVALEAGSTERFTYDPANGPLSTLSLSADAKAILFTQPNGGSPRFLDQARYLDATTGITTEVLTHLAEPFGTTSYGHCVFFPYTGIHYPAGLFHCQNGLNGGSTYVLRDGLFSTGPRLRANRAGASFFYSGRSDDAGLVDLHTGSETPLGAGWVGDASLSPRVVSESPLRVLWFDPTMQSRQGALATHAGLVPLPAAGSIGAAGPTSALGFANGASGGAVVAWSYGGATPPTSRTVAEVPGRALSWLGSLTPAGGEPSTALLEASCATSAPSAPCSYEGLVVRGTGEVERVGPRVRPELTPRVADLGVVTYFDDASRTSHVALLDARLRPHRLLGITARAKPYSALWDLHEAGTVAAPKVLVVDDEGCLRSTALETRHEVPLEALVRARHGLGPCVQHVGSVWPPATLVAQGPAVGAVGLLFARPAGGDYRVIFAEP